MARRAADGVVAGLTSVRRESPTQQVREQLLAAIQRGDYPPGSALPSERVLCDTFGVSRVSVREAIAGLEAMGLIVVQHGRGAFVRESVMEQYAGPFGMYLAQHRDELLELLKVRGALDQLAAGEAATAAIPAGLAALRAAHDAFARAAAAGEPDFAQLAQLDVAFHLSVAEGSGGLLLPSLLRELNSILDESRRMTLARPGQLDRSVRQHLAIVEAIESGNAAAARRAADKHLAGITGWIQEFAPVEV